MRLSSSYKANRRQFEYSPHFPHLYLAGLPPIFLLRMRKAGKLANISVLGDGVLTEESSEDGTGCHARTGEKIGRCDTSSLPVLFSEKVGRTIVLWGFVGKRSAASAFAASRSSADESLP